MLVRLGRFKIPYGSTLAAYGSVTPNPLIWGSGNTLIWDTGNNITWGNS